jgi:hypothetical protein
MMWKVLSQPSFLQGCRKDQTYFAVITGVWFFNSNNFKKYIRLSIYVLGTLNENDNFTYSQADEK